MGVNLEIAIDFDIDKTRGRSRKKKQFETYVNTLNVGTYNKVSVQLKFDLLSSIDFRFKSSLKNQL